MRHALHTPRRRRQAAGFTLVELLVAVTIGMALTLAITLMLVRYESGRRSLTNSNDASQGGAYVTYTLDRMLRSAGSGYAQGWANNFGCRLSVARGGTATLPRGSAFPAPFASVPQTVYLAPVLVHAGAGTDGSDVIALATGSSGMGESPLPVLPTSTTASDLRVPATTGLRANDLVLLFDGDVDCMVQQVTSPFVGGAAQTLSFGGTYAAGSIGTTTLTNFSSVNPAFVAMLGNANAARPQFQLLGVGSNATLVAHDMLQLDGADAAVAIADGVADLRVRYGIDSNQDDIVDQWVDPGVSPWNAATLHSGIAAKDALRQILALRVAVVVRSNTPERDVVSPATLTMFPDLSNSLQATRNLTADEQKLRWRVLDFTVPLRNVLLAPK
jgi:type IV pilus assembly protein PilW